MTRGRDTGHFLKEGIRLNGFKLSDLTRTALSAILANYFAQSPLPSLSAC